MNDEAVNPSKSKSKKERDWEAENAVDSILRAHEIKGDKEMMKRVRKVAGRKLKALTGLSNDITSIDDLKETYQKKYGSQRRKPDSDEFDDE